MLPLLLTAMAAFVATNIDDLLLLTLFFGQTNSNFHARHVVLGQIVGFAALIGISLLGYAGRLAVPERWLGVLGLIPLFLGVQGMLTWRREPEELAAMRLHPVGGAVASVCAVAGVTIANGGDNIGIYAPLFARQDAAALLLTLAVFCVLLVAWCWLGWRLACQPQIAALLTEAGQVVTPLVFVVLGIVILLQSGVLTLL